MQPGGPDPNRGGNGGGNGAPPANLSALYQEQMHAAQGYGPPDNQGWGSQP